MTKPARTETEVVGPAVVTEFHVQNRALSTVAWSEKGYTRLQPWQIAEDREWLRHSKKYSPYYRALAWERYAGTWAAKYAPGKDSSQALNVSGGIGETYAESQDKAGRTLAQVHSWLSRENRFLIMEVCGKGEDASVAVRLWNPSFKFAVWPRFCEALDALVWAFLQVERHPGVVNMQDVP